MKQIAILGMGPSHVELKAPFETWTVPYTVQYRHPISRIFCVHSWSEYDPNTMRLIALRQGREGFDIISSTPLPPGLKGTIYPIEEVLKASGVKIFSDLTCYMMAYAIYIEKVDKIWWYGIDCLGYTNYTIERGAVEFWAGVARGKGIEVINTMTSATLKPRDGMHGSWGNRTDNIARLLKADSLEKLAYDGVGVGVGR